jgi:alkanesulfonate monooxygenase SsuD/methylene tetrahydromethanopterin reductase-like flavin-dependent oxidoreductase (luciferase family)
VQKPHPPILIGGGAPRVLRLAGREADIVGINPAIVSGNADAAAAQNGAPEVTDQKLAWVRDAAGERYADIEINMLIFATIITDDRAGTFEQMAPLFGLDPAVMDDYPHAIIGSVESICEDLQRRRDRWDASYIVVQGDAMDALAPVVAKLAGS